MKLRYTKLFLIVALLSPFTQSANGPNYVSGKITNITSNASGLLVRIGDNELPQNCTSGVNWMQIDQEHKTMISVTITTWTLGLNTVVYTNPTPTGYCEVIQVDPEN